jgi:hypothetical protein
MQRPWRRTLSVQSSIALIFCTALPAHACWDDAAQRYQVSSALLYAIARTESGLNPLAIGRNGNGSRDIGLMQINSSWPLPRSAPTSGPTSGRTDRAVIKLSAVRSDCPHRRLLYRPARDQCQPLGPRLGLPFCLPLFRQR